jgi:Uma2 family endonuclease
MELQMSATLLERPITLDSLLAPQEEDHYEVVDGELVERNMSLLSVSAGGELYHRLHLFALDHGLGRAFGDGLGYRCFLEDPKKLRRPDVSFIQQDRLTRDVMLSNEVAIPPDLAVEVVSPNDFFCEVEAKVMEYLDAGVKLVWVLNPGSETAHVYRMNGDWDVLKRNDLLDGEEVVPGFTCRVADLFLELPAV